MKSLVLTAMLCALAAVPAWLIAADMDRRSAPDIGWPVVRIPEPEASAYVDGARKLVNDQQRNWVDMLAERAAQ